MNIGTCPRCGKVIAVTSMDSVCKECQYWEEDQFKIVYTFIRDKRNRTATMRDISTQTGVEYDLLMKFVRNKRFSTAHMPNAAYECERCGAPIKAGTICQSCTEEVKKEMNNAKKVIDQTQKSQQEYIQKNSATYKR